MIGLVKSKKTVYSNDEHEIVNNITGEILEKPDNVFMRRITVEDLFDEERARVLRDTLNPITVYKVGLTEKVLSTNNFRII